MMIPYKTLEPLRLTRPRVERDHKSQIPDIPLTLFLDQLVRLRSGPSADQTIFSASTGSAAVAMAPRLQFQFLRPYTCHALAPSTPARCSAYLRFYELAHSPARRVPKCGARSFATKQDVEEASSPEQRRAGGYITKHVDVAEETISPEQSRASRNNRIKELEAANLLDYPRFKINGMPTNPADFRTMYGQASSAELENVHVRYGMVGRITGIRRLSSNFSFVDIAHDGHGLQIMVNFKKLPPSTSMKTMQLLLTRLQRGDHICKPVAAILTVHMAMVPLTFLSWQVSWVHQPSPTTVSCVFWLKSFPSCTLQA